MLIIEGPNDPGIFKAVFMAGGPGSGKSTVANSVGLKVFGLRTINSDDALTNALKKQGLTLKLGDIDTDVLNSLRDKAKLTANKQKQLAIAGRLGLLIDSTARNMDKIKTQKKALEALGYETAMLFVDTSLDTALERNTMRHAEGGRAVPEDVVKASHKQIQAQKKKLKSLFGKTYWEVSNDGDLKDLEKNTRKWYPKIQSWTKKFPNNRQAQEWLSKFEEISNMNNNDSLNEYSFEEMLKWPDKDIIDMIRELGKDLPGNRNRSAMALRMALKKEMKRRGIKLKEETINEFKDIKREKLLKKAHKIAKDLAGNMTKATDQIEKLKKGLSDDKQVQAWLRHFNESLDEQGFTPAMVNKLRKEYGKIGKMDPSSDLYKKLKAKVAEFNKDQLDSLANAKPEVKWLTYLAKQQLNEETSTANIPQGPESVAIEPDSMFAGRPVFTCDDGTFSKCIKGKKQHERWATYLGKDNPFYQKMKSWMGQSYKNKNFVLQNAKTKEMVMARKMIGESENLLEATAENMPLSSKEQNAFKRMKVAGAKVTSGPKMSGNKMTIQMTHMDGLKKTNFTVTLGKEKDALSVGKMYYDLRFKANKNSSAAVQSSKFVKAEDPSLLKSEMKRFESMIKKELLKLKEG